MSLRARVRVIHEETRVVFGFPGLNHVNHWQFMSLRELDHRLLKGMQFCLLAFGRQH